MPEVPVQMLGRTHVRSTSRHSSRHDDTARSEDAQDLQERPGPSHRPRQAASRLAVNITPYGEWHSLVCLRAKRAGGERRPDQMSRGQGRPRDRSECCAGVCRGLGY